MQKSTKGALAASAAAVLLLGGAGSLAYWTDAATVDGGSITSGHLKLTTPSCGGWTIDGGAAFNATTGRVVPGDTLTKVCTFSVDASGDHLKANFTAAAAANTGDSALLSKVTIGATYKVGATTVSGTAVPVANGDTVTATITVDFPYGTVDNTTNIASPGARVTLLSSRVTRTPGSLG